MHLSCDRYKEAYKHGRMELMNVIKNVFYGNVKWFSQENHPKSKMIKDKKPVDEVFLKK
jgi:hypothetical protein